MNASTQATIAAILREAKNGGAGITQVNITVNVYEAPKLPAPMGNMDVEVLRQLFEINRPMSRAEWSAGQGEY